MLLGIFPAQMPDRNLFLLKTITFAPVILKMVRKPATPRLIAG